MPEPNSKYQENLRLLNDPRIQSLLKTIRSAEGATYNTRVGGSTFDDLSKKPGVMTRLKKLGINSSAEGAYQFLNKTWNNVSKDLGIKDFSPLSQDIAAVELIRRRGALDNILKGDFKGGINKLSPEWASLPKSDGKGYYSGQKVRKIDDLQKIYNGQKVPKGTYESFTSPKSYSHSKIIDLEPSPVDLEASTVTYEEPEVEEAKQDILEKSFQEDLSKLISVQQEPEQIQQVQEFVPTDLSEAYNYIEADPGYNFQEFQKGGTYLGYDLPMNNANPITPRQFTIDYLKSQKYKERLINSGYEDVDGEVKRRLLGANPEVFTYKSPPNPNIIQKLLGKKQDEGERGSYFSPFTKRIQLDSEYDINTHADVYSKAIQPKPEEIETHERSHATTSDFPEDRLNKTDIRRLNNYHKKDPNIPEHDLIPGENKADLDAFRYLLKREGIYDAGKQDFTPEIFKKTKKSATKDRLQSVYSDEAIIYLMNNVAQNNNYSDLVYGQNGGSIQTSKDFLQNWYPNRQLADTKLNSDYQAEKQLYINQSQNLSDPNYVNQIDDFNTQGTYDINTNKINILQNADPLVYTHEATHGINLPLKDTQSNVNAFSIIGQNILPQDKIQNQWVKDNYQQISNYQEVIPRLNSYRQLHGLKPDQVITPELIQSNRDSYNQGKIPFEDNTDQLYKMFENEGLSNVLNKVVTNENNSGNYYAQEGGYIPISENGMYEYPNQKVLVPTNGSITMKKIEHPILGISQDTGEQIMMQPNQEYFFKNTSSVLEIPIKKKNNRFK